MRAFTEVRTLGLACVGSGAVSLANDEHGHAAGDELLVRLADTWRRALRRGDVLRRRQHRPATPDAR